MAKRTNTLSDEDVQILQRVIDRESKRPILNSLGGSTPRSLGSADCYIALVPVGGIPAASGIEPGYEDCTIYELRNNVTSGLVELISLEFQETVYNVSTSAVSAGYCVVSREKFGYWVARPSGGSGQPVIMFVITDIVRGLGLGCNAVEATVLNISCEAASPTVGDTVEVWDSLGCIFNCPMDLLIGVRGYATRMTTPDFYSDLAAEQFAYGGPQPESPCRWEVTTLCCVEGL